MIPWAFKSMSIWDSWTVTIMNHWQCNRSPLLLCSDLIFWVNLPEICRFLCSRKVTRAGKLQHVYFNIFGTLQFEGSLWEPVLSATRGSLTLPWLPKLPAFLQQPAFNINTLAGNLLLFYNCFISHGILYSWQSLLSHLTHILLSFSIKFLPTWKTDQTC